MVRGSSTRQPEGLAQDPERLDFRGVSVRFYGRGRAMTALDRVDLTVGAGEFICLVGPSGCGKSTLLNMAAGLLAPSTGKVLHGTRTISGVNHRVGYITQKDNLLPWRTTWDNIALPLRLRGQSAAQAESNVERIIATVGLSGFERAFPRELSGGMRKRVSIARTLVYEPGTILLDEPFGALDSQLKSILQGDLAELWERTRATVLFVTHDLGEAIALADRVVVMSNRPGRIKLNKPIDIPRPRDPFQVRFDPRFSEIYEELWDSLRSEIEPGGSHD